MPIDNTPTPDAQLKIIEELLRDMVEGSTNEITTNLRNFVLYDSDSTNTCINVHYVKIDQNGRPRTHELIKSLISNITDYAIPRRTIKSAIDEVNKNGNTKSLTRLALEARELFTKLAKTGEAGELLLFVLAERQLKLPQILTKMNLKTDPNLHFNGADGAYLGVKDELLVLYWGESKFYSDFNQGLTHCINDIAPFLNNEEEANRDFQLLSSFVANENPELEKALINNYFNYESPEYDKLKLAALCMVGFDYDSCKSIEGTKLTNTHIEECINSSMKTWQTACEERIARNELEHHEIHMFLLPLKSVEEFRDLFLSELGI